LKIFTDISIEEKEIRALLDTIPDPEVPVLSVNDLGIIREITIHEPLKKIEIKITPTYSGCPAMDMIATNIKFHLLAKGYEQVVISRVLSPAWTTDWMTEDGKCKLKAFGIAPPGPSQQSVGLNLFAAPAAVQCPQCNSDNTRMISEFGSTACKALYQCNDCHEPFDVFKCH
jgi:ring-1,2-phenylacetyl-CoA epoxidase subunit PaaD